MHSSPVRRAASMSQTESPTTNVPSTVRPALAMATSNISDDGAAAGDGAKQVGGAGKGPDLGSPPRNRHRGCLAGVEVSPPGGFDLGPLSAGQRASWPDFWLAPSCRDATP